MNARTGPAIKSLHVRNLLSFGESGAEIELQPLNVLIGPNGSGKSNLIEVLGLLQSATDDLAEPFRETGGVAEWIWKGSSKSTASLEVRARVPYARNADGSSSAAPGVAKDKPAAQFVLHYSLSFRATNDRLEILDERIEDDGSLSQPVWVPRRYFAYENGRPVLIVKGRRHVLGFDEVNPQKSVLSQWKDPIQYPELTGLGRLFGSFQLYRDWEFGIDARAREASPADAPNDFLEENTRNLAVMVNQIVSNPKVRPQFIKHLQTFYADAEQVNTTVAGSGRIGLFLEEKNRFSISAARLSDGTLRWLALLTILLHPSPPPLVCLEEPELGLHPDVIRPLAKLLVDASQRMQLVVTTHSDALVDELTDTPEAVVVCEKEEGATTLKRLKGQELSEWLREYTLGELWHKGEIGGTRW